MSGDTILAIIAVSLTAIFISVFAIECDRVWQRYRAARRREMEERASQASADHPSWSGTVVVQRFRRDCDPGQRRHRNPAIL